MDSKWASLSCSSGQVKEGGDYSICHHSCLGFFYNILIHLIKLELKPKWDWVKNRSCHSTLSKAFSTFREMAVRETFWDWLSHIRCNRSLTLSVEVLFFIKPTWLGWIILSNTICKRDAKKFVRILQSRLRRLMSVYVCNCRCNLGICKNLYSFIKSWSYTALIKYFLIYPLY